MWGMFGKPLRKRAIWNTLGLHAAPTTCLRFLCFLDSACVAFCLFLSTGSHVRIIRIMINNKHQHTEDLCCFR